MRYAFLVCLAILTACSKKEPPPVVVVEDAAPPPANAPEVTELAPLTDDAGFDAGFDAGKKAASGPAVNANQLKIRQCCNAMRAQAKTLGVSPEATQINALSVQCDMIATQVGPQGTAPEFNQLRQVLKSLKLPAACTF